MKNSPWAKIGQNRQFVLWVVLIADDFSLFWSEHYLDPKLLLCEKSSRVFCFVHTRRYYHSTNRRGKI